MAETRFHNYGRPVDSFDENRRVLGIIEPGIYRGFDVFTPGAGLALTIEHGAKGIVQTNSNNTTQTNSKGVLVTRHGGIIQEDAPIAFTINTNASSSFPRYDVVLYEHQWLGSVGGSSGMYSILQGLTPQNPTNPKIQIALGYIFVPAGATLASECNWVRYAPKGLAGTNVALLDEANNFTGLQSHAWATGTLQTYTGGVVALNWDLTKNNILVSNPGVDTVMECLPKAPTGTRIKVALGAGAFEFINLRMKRSDSARMITGGINDTHDPIYIPTNTGADPYQVIEFGIPLASSGSTGPHFIELVNTGGNWTVMNVSGRSLELSIKSGTNQQGKWVDLTALNSDNFSRLDINTTLEDMSIKYVGKHLFLQGKATIKIQTATLAGFRLEYPYPSNNIGLAGSDYIAKYYQIQNITDSTVIQGEVRFYNEYIYFLGPAGPGGFEVGKTYKLNLMESIMLNEV